MNITHRDSINREVTVEYAAWTTMKSRCYNSNNKRYDMYGGRGILVCDEWLHNYSAFLAYVGRKPSPEYTLDRIDNDKGYEPGNVRWATPKEQNGNRSNSVKLDFNGKIQSLKDWSKEIGVAYKTLHARYKVGCSVEDILRHFIVLIFCASIINAQVVVTTVGTRVKITSTVNTLICSFDNIGGATTTIHIICMVPLGYILIETVTPRYTPVAVMPPGTTNIITVGGTVGSFKDDNGNIITWMLQQLVKGIINYQITDNFGQVNTGTFVPQTILAQLDDPPCNCFSYNYWKFNIIAGGTVREKWKYIRDYYQSVDELPNYWIAQMIQGLSLGGVTRDWMFNGEVIRDIR
jgi:hypothetical protein